MNIWELDEQTKKLLPTDEELEAHGLSDDELAQILKLGTAVTVDKLRNGVLVGRTLERAPLYDVVFTGTKDREMYISSERISLHP